MPKETSQTVTNALRLMECFSDTDELGITELANAIGVGKTVAARLVGSLVEFGYLRQNPRTRKYRLGVRLMYWGSLASERMEVANLIEPYLRKLAKEFQVTAHLGVRHNEDVLITGKVSMGPLVYMNSRVGNTLPMHASAMGKCILAFGDGAILEEFLATSELTRYTSTTIVTREAFLEECRGIRAKGFALDCEESNLGLSCVAIPLLDRSGRPVAAISASGQTQSMMMHQDQILERLRQIRDQIGSYL